MLFNIPSKHKNILNSWLALTLCVLFFHPLLATLHDNSIILQWRTQNTLELIAVIASTTTLLAGVLWLINRISNSKIRFILLFLIFIIPFSSFLIHLLRQLGFADKLIMLSQFAHKNLFLMTVILVCCGSIFFVLARRHPSKLTHAIIMILIALSPVNLLACWTLWDLRNVNTKIMFKSSDPHAKRTQSQKHDLIIILFDELSYEYLYTNHRIKRPYENFSKLATMSDNYHAAISPGKRTIIAIPGMLMGQRYDEVVMKYGGIYTTTNGDKEINLKTEPDNLFAIAKEMGFKTFVYGSYLPYCEMFNQSLDGCRSFSIYNYATVQTQFSLLNPIITNLILWPMQQPPGFLKNKAMSLWQKEQTEQVMQAIMTTLNEKTPVFMFSHIYCMHVPLVFDRNGYYANKKPFLQNSENYTKTLEYADHLLGEMMDQMKANGNFDSSEIIVLADHNYRTMFPSKEDHIPLIIKHSYQQKKRDIIDPSYAEKVLKQVVTQAGGIP